MYLNILFASILCILIQIVLTQSSDLYEQDNRFRKAYYCEHAGSSCTPCFVDHGHCPSAGLYRIYYQRQNCEEECRYEPDKRWICNSFNSQCTTCTVSSNACPDDGSEFDSRAQCELSCKMLDKRYVCETESQTCFACSIAMETCPPRMVNHGSLQSCEGVCDQSFVQAVWYCDAIQFQCRQCHHAMLNCPTLVTEFSSVQDCLQHCKPPNKPFDNVNIRRRPQSRLLEGADKVLVSRQSFRLPLRYNINPVNLPSFYKCHGYHRTCFICNGQDCVDDTPNFRNHKDCQIYCSS